MGHAELLPLSLCYSERSRGRTFRVTRLWCRGSPEEHEFESRLRRPTTGKLSVAVATQLYRFQIGED